MNQSYWSPKLAGNKERDIRNTRLLKESGWQVVRIWEHEDTVSALRRVLSAINAAG